MQNSSDKVLRVLFDELLTKEVTLPNNYVEGLTNVCEEENYAFMTLDNVVSQLQPKVSCKLEPLDLIMQSSIAMGVSPRSPYRQIINSKSVFSFIFSVFTIRIFCELKLAIAALRSCFFNRSFGYSILLIRDSGILQRLLNAEWIMSASNVRLSRFHYFRSSRQSL